MENAWDFVEKYYPNYYSSDEIARAADLDIILTEPDHEWNEGAQYLWDAHESNQQEIVRLQNEVMCSIYRKSIEGYLESIKEK